MKQILFPVAIVLAALVVPLNAAAQTTISESTSGSEATGVGVAQSEVESSNNASQDVVLNQNSNFEQHRPVPDVVIGTPPPSADCGVHDGVGAGLPNIGIGINRARIIQSCEAREDARSMLAVAQAAEATMGRGAGRLDVLAARNRLETAGDRNQDAYAAAREQLEATPTIQGPSQ